MKPTAGLGVGLGAGVGAALALRPLLAAASLVAAIGGLLLAVVHRRWLWVAMLTLFALFPVQWLPVPPALATLTPPVLVVAVLLLRRMLASGTGAFVVRPAVWLMVALAAWMAVAAVFSRQPGVSVGWYASFLCLAVLPALLAVGDRDALRAIETTWVTLGAILGLYALVETFVLHANPLMPFFSEAPPQLQETFGVYRATTTLGHPVDNGMFFAIAVPLALGRALTRPSPTSVLAAALAAAGVVASGTRTALVAALLGGLVVLIGPPTASNGPARSRFGARLLLTTFIVVSLPFAVAYLGERNATAEARYSAQFRTAQLPLAVQAAAESPLVGVGPGVASLTWEPMLRKREGAGSFESIWLEVVVGTGLPGLALGVAVHLAALVAAWSARATGAAGAVVAWTVTASGFNTWEGGRPQLLLFGLVLALAFAARRAPAARADDRPTGTTSGFQRGARPR